jgi:filamentous hemagglutinin family protein
MITKSWRLALVCLLGGGGAISFANCTIAQLIPDTAPDRNLGTTSQPFNAQIDIIRGGTRPSNGINLFHSFQEFSVQAGHRAYFANPIGVQNILSRVTGGNLSNIQGTIGVLGTANLFLLNPSGIIFGPNAALDVRGSFIATTANAIQLGQIGFFSASNPASSRLLEVNPSAFFFSALRTQPITHQAVLGLAVPEGRSLVLVGGDVRLEGGAIRASGGQVELSGLSGPGAIGLTQTGNLFQLSVPADTPLADVKLTRSSANSSTPSNVYVAAGGGGSITINAHNLDVLEGSILQAGIQAGLGTAARQAGDITLNATGALQVDGRGAVRNNVQIGAIGNAGNITINANSLNVANGGVLSSSTFGRGDAGNVSITVRDVATFAGVGSNGASSRAASQVGTNAVGKGGNLTLSAGSLFVTNGAALDSSTFGRGDAGDVSITVRGVATFDGVGSNKFSSRAGSQVGTNAVGKGGNLTLSAGSLFVTNEAALDSSTLGRGDAGNVSITVRGVATFDGVGSNGFPSRAGSSVGTNAVGKGGNLTLSAGSLFVTNGALLSSGTFGRGDAGNVSISVRDVTTFAGVDSNGFPSGAGSQVGTNAVGRGGNLTLSTGSLFMTNGAGLSSTTFGRGDAGNVSISVRDVTTFAGVDSNGFPSGAGSQVGTNAVGRGGNLTLSTGSLLMTNGAGLSSTTFGRGDAGNVSISVRDVATFDGINSNGFASGAGSQVGPSAVGKGGNLTLSTGSLFVTNGAILSSTTFRQGDAGNILISVRDIATFDGVGSNGFASGAGSSVGLNAVGKGGNLTLSTGSLFVTNRAVLSSGTVGRGDAGNILLRIRDQLLLFNGAIATTSLLTSGGVIDISAQSIRMSGNSNIQTKVFIGAGNGGNITLKADSIVVLDDSNILASARTGRGGNITLNTRAFFGQNYRPAPPGTDPLTLIRNGRVDVNASGAVSGIITLPDTTFIQNSLAQLPQTLTDVTQLLASSCIVRREQQNGSFMITGSGGLPDRPDNPSASPFPTGEVRSVDGDSQQTKTQTLELKTQNDSDHPWKIGDPISEPQGVYQLANGQLVMSRECDR